MPVCSYTKSPSANEDLAESVNCGTDQWAIALTNTVPASKSFTLGTTDLPATGGYAIQNVGTTSAGMNGSDFVLVLADPPTWTATGEGFTFQYALLVNRTLNIIPGYWNYGSSQVVAAGETVTVDLDQTATVGVFKIT